MPFLTTPTKGTMRKEGVTRQAVSSVSSLLETRIPHPEDRICAVAVGSLSVVAPVHIAVKCIQRVPVRRRNSSTRRRVSVKRRIILGSALLVTKKAI